MESIEYGLGLKAVVEDVWRAFKANINVLFELLCTKAFNENALEEGIICELHQPLAKDRWISYQNFKLNHALDFSGKTIFLTFQLWSSNFSQRS
ncbi:hypothetical protein NHP190012_16420 (plasmid) [Helicobacter sp. NHP19-012]|uniref:Uncharacterized protein n=1 Tax=Helicobacter gastrofelis TaxID=2849642 RepID=A0ABM7SQQ7_9HELI|nr:MULTISPECIES: hypothetical protein [unclassified Helicobacter]BCZ20000.1 hypothetical protein NHP190012_16420 [Helicobacter sp. NHP19-012]GMB96964.1 hypothetical protein NHP22001_15560 [Helicobacter sp. NHP22-001]